MRVAQLLYGVLLCNVPFLSIFHGNLSRSKSLHKSTVAQLQLGLGRSLRAAAFEARSVHSDLTRLTLPNSVEAILYKYHKIHNPLEAGLKQLLRLV